jgi:DNA mismatch endonuclease (patch repair protein)
MKLPYPTPTSPAATAVMKGNRRRDTKAELRLRSAIHRRGLRFRKDFPIWLDQLTVRPDLVFPRRQVAVFVDGCFWHGCPQHGNVPTANRQYWAQKLQRNRNRDGRVDQALMAAGWKIVRVWEHEEIHTALERVMRVLETRGAILSSPRSTVSRQVPDSKSEYPL